MGWHLPSPSRGLERVDYVSIIFLWVRCANKSMVIFQAQFLATSTQRDITEFNGHSTAY